MCIRSGGTIRRLPRLNKCKKGLTGQAQINADYKRWKIKKTYKIIGAAMEVHRELGCGFLEPVYQETLAKEFDSQNIPYRPQPIVKIFYKGCEICGWLYSVGE